ncbi:MAG: L,D-transpeptidase [Pseudolabrys sp.]|nr:L,D-transpeptidase [Pseudolabrys sp.]MDP2297821.1 L,D-transpeptidase [Pseudolabrys sp.]
MRFANVLASAAAMLVFAASAAQARIVVTVDKSAQQLTVQVDGATHYQWPVSTARWGYRTPNGSYRPERLERQWYSRKYDWSPMPHSIFFHHGYAIHGSHEISRLGRPASHGCIRLHPRNAATLFELVRRNIGDTRIVVVGGGEELMAARRPVRRSADVFVATRPRNSIRYVTPRVSRASESFEEIFTAPPRFDRRARSFDLD